MTGTQTPKKNDDTTEIAELTENKYIKQLLNSKIIKYFSSDPSSKIALATAMITVGSFLVRLLDYMRWKGYLSLFSMNIDYSHYSASQGFSEFLLQAIVFVGFLTATSLSYLVIDSLWFAHGIRKISYSIRKTKFRSKIWRFAKETIEYVPIILGVFVVNCFLNFLLWTFTASAEIITYSSMLEWGVVLLTFAGLELVAANILLFANSTKRKREVKAKKKEAEKTDKEKLVDEISKSVKFKRPLVVDIALSSVSLYIFMLCTSAYFVGTWEAQQVDRFSFVENHYAVIYQDDDCYWTVFSTEDGDVLHLDTTRQKVIEIHGVEIEYRDYEEVTINYD